MPREITIIGAGFSGLATAYYLTQAGCRVRLLEKNARVGGLLGTQQTDYGLVETAANGLLNSVQLETLCAALGVQLQAPLPSSRARYLWRDERLRRWPLRFGESLRLGAGLAWYAGRWRPRAGETVAAWGARVLGPATVDAVLTPALGGVYASTAEHLSASLIFNRQNAQKSPPPSQRGTVSFAGGTQTLLDAWQNYLTRRGVTISLPCDAQLERDKPTVICTSAPTAAGLLRECAPDVSAQLATIEMLPLVTATCFYARTARQPLGFGCLFPRNAGWRALGVLFNDCTFAGRSELRSETWILGGDATQSTDDELMALLCVEHARLVGADEALLHCRLTRWPQALPHYTLALERTLAALAPLPHKVHLVGNYLGQIGLTKILARAQHVAAQVKEQI